MGVSENENIVGYLVTFNTFRTYDKSQEIPLFVSPQCPIECDTLEDVEKIKAVVMKDDWGVLGLYDIEVRETES